MKNHPLIRTALRFITFITSTLLSVVILLLLGYATGWIFTGKTKTSSHTAIKSNSPPQTQKTGQQPQHSAQHLEPQTLLATLTSGRNSRDAEIALTVKFAALSENELVGLLTKLENSPPYASTRKLQFLLIQRWASLNPRFAFDYAQAHFPKEVEDPGVGSFQRAVLFRWMQSDPYGALAAWHELAPHNDDDLFTLQTLFTSLAGRHTVGEALSATSSLLPDHRTAALRGIASLAHNENARTEILTHFTTVEDQTLRVNTIGAALFSWAERTHPNDAIEWLHQSPLPPSDKTALEGTIADAWLLRNQPEAAEWYISGSTSPVDRARRLERIVNSWGPADPRDCAEWLLSQGIDEHSSKAVKLFSAILAREFPREAVQWARAIPNDTIRSQALARIEQELNLRYPTHVKSLH